MRTIIPLVPVVGSSNIAAKGYNAATRELDVQFHSGDTWRYFGVEPADHDAFDQAESKGSHFAQNIVKKYEGVDLAKLDDAET